MLFKSTLNMKQIAQRYLPPHNCCFLNRSPGGHHGSHTIGHTQWLWDRKTHTHWRAHTHTHTQTHTHKHTHTYRRTHTLQAGSGESHSSHAAEDLNQTTRET